MIDTRQELVVRSAILATRTFSPEETRMSEALSYRFQDGIALITMDDGKVNALSHTLIKALEESLKRAEKEARAVIIAGRPGRLSAGFDLSVMKSGPTALQALVRAGVDLLLRIYEFPRPVIIACSGHAMAAGALMLLAADYRIGVEGPFKIGLNEVSIGMPIPIIGIEMARERLTPRSLHRATLLAEVFDPEDAVHAGYLDQLATPEQLLEASMSVAQRLCQLKDPAFQQTRAHLRRAGLKLIRESLDEDIASLAL